MILCGGKGTRLSEETAARPKPMVTVGGHPILWHIMSGYAAQGFNRFTLAAGHMADHIKNFFLNYAALNSDFEVDLATGEVTPLRRTKPVDWKVRVVDTGSESMTGGRLHRLESFLQGSGTFFFTYGDGVSDVDLKALLEFHRKHGKLCTITAVKPAARFGGLEINDGRIEEFREKLPDDSGWINGGFMVMEPKIFDYLHGDATVLEQDPMRKLAKDGQLMAFQHEGFWQPMDTLRDRQHLEELWESGRAPWKTWRD
ncbi:MAG: glucose-1-phosphate cytidylyltransferase [Bdellovibrionales bacterium]|nr:glucose-1-phosphate cytidylyltransferase [Bdellovibrionales bacterium]